MDDVLLDFAGGLAHAVWREYGVTVELDTWDIAPRLNPILGQSWWKWMRARDWLWPNFPAIPGAIGGLTQLRNDGHYLEIVTSKPEWAEFSVWKWLGKWRPPVHRVTIMDSGKGQSKLEVTDAALIVDDKPSTVDEWMAEGRMAILFTGQSSYKRDHEDYTGDALKAKSWSRVVSLVKELNDA
jgi:hypothetical protein